LKQTKQCDLISAVMGTNSSFHSSGVALPNVTRKFRSLFALEWKVPHRNRPSYY